MKINTEQFLKEIFISNFKHAKQVRRVFGKNGKIYVHINTKIDPFSNFEGKFSIGVDKTY